MAENTASENTVSENKELEKAASKKRKQIAIVLACLCVVCFVVYYVFSSIIGNCGAATEGICSPEAKYFGTTFVGQLGNAGLVFTLLWYFGAPIVQKMIADRQADLERDIRESTKKKEAAELEYEKAEKKMQVLSSEIKKMTRGYEETTARECAQIAESAQATAERLRKDAETSFELQSNVAKTAFEKELMKEAIDRAGNAIKQKLASDRSMRDRLIEQSIASLDF